MLICLGVIFLGTLSCLLLGILAASFLDKCFDTKCFSTVFKVVMGLSAAHMAYKTYKDLK